MKKLIFFILVLIANLTIITSSAFANNRPRVLIIPIENGGLINNFEQLNSYDTIIHKEILNLGTLYPVPSKDRGLVLNSTKPRQTKFRNQVATSKRSFFANQTNEVARRNNVDYLLHSNVLDYNGAIVNERSQNITITSPTVSGTIGVSLIRPSDACVVWYYETTATVNTAHYKLNNGFHGGRKDVDNALYYSLLEKLCQNIAKRLKADIKF